MTVRCARPDEWRALRDVRLRALAESPAAFERSLAEEEALPEEAWRGRAEPRDDRVVLVCDDLAGGLVGVDEGDAVRVAAMWVAPERRGEGLGRALLDEVLAWARARGAERVRLDVNPDQAPALRLYETAGFARTGGDRPIAATGCTCVELELAL